MQNVPSKINSRIRLGFHKHNCAYLGILGDSFEIRRCLYSTYSTYFLLRFYALTDWLKFLLPPGIIKWQYIQNSMVSNQNEYDENKTLELPECDWLQRLVTSFQFSAHRIGTSRRPQDSNLNWSTLENSRGGVETPHLALKNLIYLRQVTSPENGVYRVIWPETRITQGPTTYAYSITLIFPVIGFCDLIPKV